MKYGPLQTWVRIGALAGKEWQWGALRDDARHYTLIITKKKNAQRHKNAGKVTVQTSVLD
jgi:hypothetical protein